MDIVFTNLPDSPDVENSCTRGKWDYLNVQNKGLIFVDNSTIKPAISQVHRKHLSEKGIFSLDAPVSGGDIGAKNGTLAIMVGGPSGSIQKSYPVFEAMGKTIIHVGDSRCRSNCQSL